MTAPMVVRHTIKGDGSMLHLVSDGVTEFVVQVVDRESMILRRRVTQTSAWPTAAVNPAKGCNPVKAKFWAASVRSRPVLKLDVASVEAACEALTARRP